MPPELETKSVRIDRTIPLALIFAVIIQACSALVWAGAAENRLNKVEEQMANTHETELRAVRTEERLVRLENSIARVEAALLDLRAR